MPSVLIAVILLAVVAVIVLATGALAPAPPGSLTITVQNEDGQPVPNATVTVQSLSGLTSSSGVWSKSPPSGTRTVTVTAPDYVPYTGSIHILPDAQNTETVIVKGYSSLTPWVSLRDAIRALPHGPQRVDITYSFIPPGVTVTTDPEHQSLHITDHIDGSMTSAQFKQEIADAFAAWTDLFESVYPTLTLTFTETTELNSPPLFGAYTERNGGVGDFRIGMYDMQEGGTLAYAYGPDNSWYHIRGDILFDAGKDWRLDADVVDGDGGNGGYSVKYVAAHEIGHSLGFGHHVLSGSLMAPTAGRSIQLSHKFPGGLPSSVYERNGALGIFA